MIRKIVAIAVVCTMVACGSSKKTYIKTTKNGTVRNNDRKTKPSTTKQHTATAANNNKANSTEVLESTSRTVVYSEQVKDYVGTYKDIAKDNMKRHGIPASITLAQGILESGAGRGTLCINANNHFGIKCHTDWKGDKVYHDDDSAQECFRKYDRPAQSFEDHSQFLTTRSRYANLFKLDKDDYKAWARGLKAAGYATDPKYPDKLISLIERFELAQYDQEVLGGKYVPKTEPVKQPETVKQSPAIVSTPAKTIQQANDQTPAQAVASNDSHTVVKGDTLYSISKKHNTTVDELIRLNGLNGNAISIGQVLKVR